VISLARDGFIILDLRAVGAPERRAGRGLAGTQGPPVGGGRFGRDANYQACRIPVLQGSPGSPRPFEGRASLRRNSLCSLRPTSRSVASPRLCGWSAAAVCRILPPGSLPIPSRAVTFVIVAAVCALRKLVPVRPVTGRRPEPPARTRRHGDPQQDQHAAGVVEPGRTHSARERTQHLQPGTGARSSSGAPLPARRSWPAAAS